MDTFEFRSALGQFATGVCVITAKAKDGTPFGMTVNSFASVSLEPPLVLWSLRNDSECYADFDAARHYTVNILAADQIALSNQYSKKNAHQLNNEHYRIGKSGAPVLRGALTSFECERWQCFDGGDHIILVGRVIEIGKTTTGHPLVFHAGKYRELR